MFQIPSHKAGDFFVHYIKRRIRGTAVWDKVKQAAAEDLKLPKDVVLGEVLVSFVGRSQAVIENYRSILVYTDETIRLQARNCRLEFHGRRLHIDYYNHDQMRISGQIREMVFCS
jgi:sporulation protein YqfC